jgi:putative ABC transport system permease protein
MDFLELINQSIKALSLNKLRTGLATLGIVIGIGSVIALISLGQSTQKAIESQIQSLGSNLLTIIPGAQSNGPIRTAAGSNTTLTSADAKALHESSEMKDVQTFSPELSRRSQVTAGRNNTNTQIIGVTPAYADVHKVTLSSGSFVTQRDLDQMSKVAIIGPQVATTLFDTTEPIGQTIRVSGQTLKVIGVTVSKGGSGFLNQDDVIYIPLTTAQKQLYGVDYLSTIAAEAKSPEVMTDAQNEIGYFLLARHKFNDPAQADFSIISQNDILNTASAATGTFTALLGGIAAISLLVGGIGIMNIMLMAVTERTREIGLRKALGAKKKVIITQFIIESIILTSTGGLFGMLLGAAISYGLATLLKAPFSISFQSMALAIGVSGGIGLLFGWYPAQKAASLQPIEALRYE